MLMEIFMNYYCSVSIKPSSKMELLEGLLLHILPNKGCWMDELNSIWDKLTKLTRVYNIYRELQNVKIILHCA